MYLGHLLHRQTGFPGVSARYTVLRNTALMHYWQQLTTAEVSACSNAQIPVFGYSVQYAEWRLTVTPKQGFPGRISPLCRYYRRRHASIHPMKYRYFRHGGYCCIPAISAFTKYMYLGHLLHRQTGFPGSICTIRCIKEYSTNALLTATHYCRSGSMQ